LKPEPGQVYFEPGLAYFAVFSSLKQTQKSKIRSNEVQLSSNFTEMISKDVYKRFPKDQPLKSSESIQILKSIFHLVVFSTFLKIPNLRAREESAKSSG